MNNSNINTRVYAQKVELLLRLMPIIMEEGVFAVHGGTAINLFIKDFAPLFCGYRLNLHSFSRQTLQH